MTLIVFKHSNQPCSVIFVNFYNFLNSDVIMSSLVSTGNCKLGHDCRRVCNSRRNCRQLVANSCSNRQRRRDKTVSSRRRRRCVLGISSAVKYCFVDCRLQLHKSRFTTAQFDFTTAHLLINCTIKYALF